MTPAEGAITMQDVRLVCGEGKLETRHVLDAVNIILKRRAERAAQSPTIPLAPWQTIETAPKDGTSILALRDGVRPIWCDVIFWDKDEPSPFKWMTNDGASGYHEDMYTHWMPLPAPPVTRPHQPSEAK